MAKRPQPASAPTEKAPTTPASSAKTIKMERSEPMHAGGPTTADVHPDEVENWAAAGWQISE